MSSMGVFSSMGDIIFCHLSTVGDIIIHVGDIMIHVGDIMSTVGCSVPWGYSNNKRLFPHGTTENSKGMKDVGTSNVNHVSRKPLQCIHITAPYESYVVQVTFRSHHNAYDLFSNTRLSSSLFNSGENNVIF